jgi:hypothetical protein
MQQVDNRGTLDAARSHWTPAQRALLISLLRILKSAAHLVEEALKL